MQIYLETDGRFAANCTYKERLAFKEAGWWFDGTIKRWVTDDAVKAYQFYPFMDDAAAAEIDRRHDAKLDALKLSQTSNLDITIPAPAGLAFDPHQISAIYTASLRPGTLIADPPGCGKTMIAIGLSNYLPEIKSVLIIPPSHLTINWKREWLKWDTKGMSVGIVGSNKKSEKIIDLKTGKPERTPSGAIRYRTWIDEYVWPDTDVVICPYSMLETFHDQARSRTWDLKVCDESHYLANKDTIRTQLTLGRKAIRATKKTPAKEAIAPIPAVRRLLMTGTPILSRPVELWPTVKALDPNDLGRDWTKFTQRYCSAYLNKSRGKPFWDTSGASNLNELQLKLRSSIMIRRNKTDIMKDLPAKRRQLIELPKEGLLKAVDAEMAALEAIRDSLAEFAGDRLALMDADRSYWNRLAGVLESKFGNWADAEYVAQIKDLAPPTMVAFEQLSSARKALALAKVPMIVDHLNSYIESGEKVIVFVVHTAMAEALQLAYPTAALVTGRIPVKQRQAAVDRFQTDPECPMIICNITAGGTGYTMTAAHIVVFAELDWIPSLIEQAEDRAWRRGQETMVLAQHLVVEGSIDAHMVEILLEKQAISHDALDAETLDLSKNKSLLFS